MEKIKKLYVGTREPRELIENILNKEISHLNEKLSKNLRTSVLMKGIKKTEQGQKLMFYVVNNEEYRKLLEHNMDILVEVDSEPLNNKLTEINSKYPRRMNIELSEKYKLELQHVFVDLVLVVGKDKNIRKQPKRNNNYLHGNSRLGKLIYKTDGYLYNLGMVKDFFEHIFNEGFVKSFSFRIDNSNSLTYGQWDSSIDLNCVIRKNFEECYRSLTQWSDLGGCTENRISMYNLIDDEFTIYVGYSHDGFSNSSKIVTTKHIKDLFYDFEKV